MIFSCLIELLLPQHVFLSNRNIKILKKKIKVLHFIEFYQIFILSYLCSQLFYIFVITGISTENQVKIAAIFSFISKFLTKLEV